MAAMNRRTRAPATTANPRYNQSPESNRDDDFAFDIDNDYDEGDGGRNAEARQGRAGRPERQQSVAGPYPEYGERGSSSSSSNNYSRNDTVDDKDGFVEGSINDGEGVGVGQFDNYNYNYNDHDDDYDNNDDGDEDSWRKPGRQFRSNLMRLDAKNSFQLKPECAIERYYQVADRVMEQFLHHPIDDRDEIIEAYLIGSRLVHFLSSILPTHPEYFAPEPTLAKLRDRAQSQLAELTGYAEVLAIMLDKQEHERYVSRVLLREEPSRAATAAAVDDDDDEEYGDGTVDRNPPELEGGGQYGDDQQGDDDGDSFGGRRPAPRADHSIGKQRTPLGRHSRPPLAARHSSTSSSTSDAVPTFEIDIRKRRNGNVADNRDSHTDSRSRSARDNDLLIAQQMPPPEADPEADDRSASQDSSRPLLTDDSQPRRQYRFGRGAVQRTKEDDDDNDWDVAWVRRHGRMHAVLDQESSVATGDSSNVERSTVDSSLMNPPEPRYSPLVSASNGSPARRRRDLISTSQANRAALLRGPSSGTTPKEGLGLPQRDDEPQAPVPEPSPGRENQRRYPQKQGDEDPSFLRERPAIGKRHQAPEWDGQPSNQRVQEELFATVEEVPSAGWDQHVASTPASTSSRATIESATDGTSANRNHKDTRSGRFTEERKTQSSTGRSSPPRDVLEDPENRWFGDEDTASVVSKRDEAHDDFRGQDPYDERFLPDLQYDDRGFRPSPGNAKTHHFDAKSSTRQEIMAEQDFRQDQDITSHLTNRRYVPGSLRERAALRRQSSDASQPRFDEVPANAWVDFGRFDVDREGRAQRAPSPPREALNQSLDPFYSELESEGTRYPHDPFADHAYQSSAPAATNKTIRESLATKDETRFSRSAMDVEPQPRTVSALPTREEKGFKVSVTVDGKECSSPSDSLPLTTNENIPNHRLSSVRASAERLKALRSRRLDHRSRTQDEYRVDDRPTDALPNLESPQGDHMTRDTSHPDDKARNESAPTAQTFCVDEASADVETKGPLDLNTSIENDSVLNGEVEQILTRESSMMCSKYESFNTSVSMNEPTTTDSNTHDLSEAFDCSDDRCEGDDEASYPSVFDPFFDEDSSAQRDLVETRKRQDVLIEAMRLEQRTYLNSTPPRIGERGKLIPSSRDTYYTSKRKPQASIATEQLSNQDRSSGPVDLDATVDEDDESDRVSKNRELGDEVPEPTSDPSLRGYASTGVASPVGNRTRIEERMNEARRSSEISSPTSVLALPENQASECPDKFDSLAASRKGHTAKSSSESAATTQGTFGEEDDDTAMLNGVMARKRRPMTHFRGCVRFLLE